MHILRWGWGGIEAGLEPSSVSISGGTRLRWWWKWRDEYRGGCIPHPPLYKNPVEKVRNGGRSKVSVEKNFYALARYRQYAGRRFGWGGGEGGNMAARAREFCLVGQRPEWAASVGALQVAVDESGGGVVVDHGKTPWLAHKSRSRTYETL